MADQILERVKEAHTRLKRASQNLEQFAAKELPPGQDPPPIPGPELAAAIEEFEEARREVYRLHKELFGWEPPGREHRVV